MMVNDESMRKKNYTDESLATMNVLNKHSVWFVSRVRQVSTVCLASIPT